jgi:hypothetical protein
MKELWLLLGGVVGVVNGLTRWWTVARLRPDIPSHALAIVLSGAILRWSLVAALLTFALQRGIGPALLAFAGLWLSRWGTVIWFNAQRPAKEL